jgi:hypothetical protein
MRSLLFALPLLLAGSAALAQGQPAQSVVPGNAGSRGPGGLTAGEVVHKWLLDANGATIGWIDSVADHEALVHTKDGKHLRVEMHRLSLGNGPNTVIESGHSEADDLNRLQLSAPPRRDR